MADFDMDIDSPYPIPQRDTFEAKPNIVPYTNGQLKIQIPMDELCRN